MLLRNKKKLRNGSVSEFSRSYFEKIFHRQSLFHAAKCVKPHFTALRSQAISFCLVHKGNVGVGHGGNFCQALDADTLGAQVVAAVLELFFHADSGAHHVGTGLTHNIDQTLQGVALGQKVVYDQNIFALVQVFFADSNAVGVAVGVAFYLADKQVVVNIGAFGLFACKVRRI